jgi:hypothetical protein
VDAAPTRAEGVASSATRKIDVMQLMQCTRSTSTTASPVGVGVDGSSADRPALAWGAAEASQLGRPLLISHAVGHLPPGLDYGERRAVSAQRREAGQRVVEEAATWTAREVPGLSIQTAVRLLDPTALMPAVARRAHAMTQSTPAWGDAPERHGPAVAALRGSPGDTQVLAYATDYARRRLLDLVVLDMHEISTGSATVPPDACVTLTSGPGHGPSDDQARRSWAVASRVIGRLPGPLVVVSGS